MNKWSSLWALACLILLSSTTLAKDNELSLVCEPQFAILESKYFPEIKEQYFRFLDRTVNYWVDVGQSPFYLRFFIKNKESVEEVKRDFLGFFPLTDPKDIRFTLQFIPRAVTRKFLDEERDFTILGGINKIGNILLEKSFGHLEEDSRLRQYFSNPELSKVSGFILDMIAISGFFGIYDWAVPELMVAIVNYRVKAQYEMLGKVLRYDYRYKFIKDRLKRGELSEFESRKAVYLLNLAYKNYYDYMAHQYSKDSFVQMAARLHDNILFSHLANFSEKGVESTSAYYAADPGFLDKNQIETLYNIHHRLYLGEQAVSDWAWDGANSSLDKISETDREILKPILAKKFEQELLAFRDQGQISNLEMMYYIQLDLSLRRLYAERQILQIIPYRTSGGHPIAEFNLDTLKDLHDEVLNDIRTRTRLP